jgi:hypothetical protein
MRCAGGHNLLMFDPTARSSGGKIKYYESEEA